MRDEKRYLEAADCFHLAAEGWQGLAADPEAPGYASRRALFASARKQEVTALKAAGFPEKAVAILRGDLESGKAAINRAPRSLPAAAQVIDAGIALRVELIAAGRRDEGGKALQEGIDAARDFLSKPPPATEPRDARRVFFGAVERLANVLLESEPKRREAVDCLGAAAAGWEELAGDPMATSEFWRSAVFDYQSAAHSAYLAGDTNRAAALAKKAIALRDAAIARSPESSPEQWRKADTLRVLAEIERKRNRLEEAEAALRASIDLFEKAFPKTDEKPLRKSFAVALFQFAELLKGKNQPSSAIPAYRRSVALMQEYLGGRPGDAYETSVIHNGQRELITLLEATGAIESAMEARRDFIEDQKRRFKQTPDSSQALTALGGEMNSYALKAGQIGQISEANRASGERAELWADFVARHPEDNAARAKLIAARGTQAELFAQQGKRAEVERLCDSVKSSVKALEAAKIDDSAKFSLAWGCYCLSNSLHVTGDSQNAEPLARRAVALSRELHLAAPNDVERLKVAAFCLSLSGQVLSSLGDLTGAAARLSEAEQFFKQVIAKQPADVLLLDRLADVQSESGNVAKAQNRDGAAVEAYLGALSAYLKAAIADPKAIGRRSRIGWCCDTLAWALADWRNEKPPNADDVIAAAQKLVGQFPTLGEAWRMWGTAEFRAGRHAEAVSSLAKAIQLDQSPDASCFLVLAMSEWHLGQKEEAKRLYEEGVKRPLKRTDKKAELDRLRSEAAVLLGLEAAAK